MTPRPEARRRSGALAAEVVVAVLVVAALAVPVLTLLFRERDAGQRARFQYAALLAARDEMYEAQFAVLAGARAPAVAHDWQPLTGGPLDRLRDALLEQDVLCAYSPEQARIATRLVIDPRTGPLGLGTVRARWTDVEDPRGRPTSVELTFCIPGSRGPE